jgi:hypothetical protein
LLVIVLAVGSGLGWLARGARIQRDAVAAIEKAGGSVTYSWQWRDGKTIPGAEPWAPRWLVDLVGVDYFGHVILVTIHGQTDAGMQVIATLPELEFLDVSESALSDAGLVHLKGLSRLRTLLLDQTAITDNGLVHLEELTNLSGLSLYNTRVTDNGLVHLRPLTKIATLNLIATQVTDAGLVNLETMSNLEYIELTGTRVTNERMIELRHTLPSVWISGPSGR